ncbi:MAG: hypothetical protein ACR2M0_09105 [Chloroflexia bacterium]
MRRTPATARLFFAAVLLLVAALGLLPGGGAPVAARIAAQAPAPLPFIPLTLDDAGQVSFVSAVSWLQVSGDWAAYAKLVSACGHCAPPVGTITLKNLIDQRTITLQMAMITEDDSCGGDPPAADGFEFACNCPNGDTHNGPRLLWTQPTQAPCQYEYFLRGTLACDRCYFDPAANHGGPWTGGDLAPDPPSPYDVSVEPAADPDLAGTFRIADRSTEKVLLRVPAGGHGRVERLATSGDALVYVLDESLPPQYLYSKNLIHLVWLGAPDPAFGRVWSKADAAVAAGTAPRSWLWGPTLLYRAAEAYAQRPGGRHDVEYYDKARMEVNDPSADPNSPYYVTNGLLTVEMISGDIQTGNTSSIHETVPCILPVVGDPRKDNPIAPDYNSLAGVASLHGEHQAPNRVGQPVSDALDTGGGVYTDIVHSGLSHYAAFVTQTGHNIPDLFWHYLQDMQPTYGFDWTYVLGYPITEGYWTQMRVSGRDLSVMIQAYQRRVLTYVPDFAPTWRIQQGNVGQHYFEWRYELNK